MKKLQFVVLIILLVLSSCKKNKIISVTTSSGKVVEQSTNSPLSGVKVVITNGQRDLVSTTTNSDGQFCFDVNFDKVTPNDSLSLDGSPTLPSKKYELKGMGKSEYNYGTLWLYNKNDDNYLPLVSTDSIINVNPTTVIVKGEILSNGGFNIIESGICYATHQTPTISDSVCKAGYVVGGYSCNLSNLQLNTTYYVRAFATNSIGTKYGQQMNFTTVNGLASVITNDAADIAAISATLGGNIIEDGGFNIIKRGVCYGQNQMPSFKDHVKEAGGINGTGEFVCEVNNLSPLTDYYHRAFAINSIDTVFGNVKSFRTTDGKPVVVTHNAINVTESTAILGGEVITDNGYPITQRGVCYATHQNPTMDDLVVSGGDGIGVFSCNITNLTSGATYYYRAFAVNEIAIVFGDKMSFDAINGMPTVSTLSPTNILPTSATCGGIVIDEGSHNVTERGVCWSTEHDPNPNNSPHVTNGTGPGSFTVQITGLTPSTHYFVKAYATNSDGTSTGDEKDFYTPAISTPSVTTQEITDITRTTAVCGGIITSDGGSPVTERGICWSTSPNPTISNNHATNGVGLGNYVITMTGLTPNTIYYVKAYAINAQGENYGEQKQFRTENISIPAVTTASVTNITQTTATSGGNVTDEGGGNVIERGICWSTSHNPTINDNHANNGTGMGIYTVAMTGLEPGTTYYVRAYARNEIDTGYGNEIPFETQPIQSPIVNTANISDITHTTATGGGNVTADGGSPVTERGICWSTSPNPTIDDNHAYSGMGIGSFTIAMTELTPGTPYYVRAYAKNIIHTGYGQDVVFTTLSVSEPTVTTFDVTDISQNTAICGGNVLNDGGSDIIERGLCWSTYPNPTINDEYLSSGTGLGQFTIQMMGLEPNVTYYVKAYAKNSSLTGYGASVTFTTLPPPPPTGAIAGLYTINNSGNKVYFSQGNLLYKATSETWKFADNQWDIVGESNSNISATYNGWIDLFGWGTSGYHNPYDNFNVNYQPYSSSSTTVNTDCNAYGYGPSTNMPDPSLTNTSAEYDWGIYNQIINGGNQVGLWRVLSKEEWDYVLKTRSASTIGSTTNARFAMATVNGISGVILFPDTYSHPDYLPTPLSINNTSASYNVNSYSDDGWTAMENLGCVFLPAAGVRFGTSTTYNGYSTVHTCGSFGIYWSSTHYNASYVYHILFKSGRFCYSTYNLNNFFPSTSTGVNTGCRYRGHSVRLVQDY